MLSADYQMAKLVPYLGTDGQTRLDLLPAKAKSWCVQYRRLALLQFICSMNVSDLRIRTIQCLTLVTFLARVLHGSSGSIYFLTMQQWHGLMRWYNNIYLISSIYRFLWLGTQSSPLTSCFEPSLNPTVEVMYSLSMNCIGTNPTKQVWGTHSPKKWDFMIKIGTA